MYSILIYIFQYWWYLLSDGCGYVFVRGWNRLFHLHWDLSRSRDEWSLFVHCIGMFCHDLCTSDCLWFAYCWLQGSTWGRLIYPLPFHHWTESQCLSWGGMRGLCPHPLLRFKRPAGCKTLCALQPYAGSGVVGIDPLHFLAGCRTRRLNQV